MIPKVTLSSPGVYNIFYYIAITRGPSINYFVCLALFGDPMHNLIKREMVSMVVCINTMRFSTYLTITPNLHGILCTPLPLSLSTEHAYSPI